MICAPQGSLQHYLQYPTQGSNLKPIKERINIEDMVHVENGLLLGHKKNVIMPSETCWMDLGIIMLSEVSERQSSYVTLCGG